MYDFESESSISAEVSGDQLPDSNLHDTITAISNEADYYPIDKLEAHINNIPHVAISIFLFHGQRLLIQRRARSKYHSGGLWANTVCSHPRWQESIADCAKRRLQEELGVTCDVRKFGEINYEAKVGSLFENEQVHCLIGHLDTRHSRDKLKHSFNPAEVCDIAFMTLSEIQVQMQQYPQRFTEWFKIYLSMYRDLINKALLQAAHSGRRRNMTAEADRE